MTSDHLIQGDGSPSLPMTGRLASWRRQTLKFSRRWPLGAASVVFIVLLALVAVFAPLVAPYGPLELHRSDRLLAPGGTYLLGTDETGRDQLSRLIYATRVSLYVGIVPIIISLTIGIVLGMVSAFFGDWVDSILQRAMDAMFAFPALLLALVLVSLLGANVNNIVLAIAVVMIPGVNRVARGESLRVMGQEYMIAARSSGATDLRMLLRHLLPNMVAPIVIVGASLIGVAILSEAGLSFLGLGIPPPDPTWGNMIGGENRSRFEVAPWLMIFPGLAITVTVLAFNILGDTIRDILDPRVRRSGASQPRARGTR